jgi:hypothetical protein
MDRYVYATNLKRHWEPWSGKAEGARKRARRGFGVSGARSCTAAQAGLNVKLSVMWSWHARVLKSEHRRHDQGHHHNPEVGSVIRDKEHQESAISHLLFWIDLLP